MVRSGARKMTCKRKSPTDPNNDGSIFCLKSSARRRTEQKREEKEEEEEDELSEDYYFEEEEGPAAFHRHTFIFYISYIVTGEVN